jgi:hypothetical protein
MNILQTAASWLDSSAWHDVATAPEPLGHCHVTRTLTRYEP